MCLVPPTACRCVVHACWHDAAHGSNIRGTQALGNHCFLAAVAAAHASLMWACAGLKSSGSDVTASPMHRFACTVMLLQDCDAALLRRFSRRMEVPLPGEASRAAFFQSMLSRPEVESNLSTEDISQLARLTQGYSGSDLADLCRTAALAPVRELMRQQRQQLGSKRRRLGSDLGWASRVHHGSMQGGADAGSPVDSTGCTDGQPCTVGDAGAAAERASQPEVQLRALVLADFTAALELVRPAAADAEPVALG